MNAQSLFFFAFIAQIMVISIYIPRTLIKRMQYVTEHYPPDQYPRLYPKSLDYYEARRNLYSGLNWIVAIVGFVTLVGLVLTEHDYDIDNAVAFVYLLLQVLPLIWFDLSMRQELKLMRELDTRTTRTAGAGYSM